MRTRIVLGNRSTVAWAWLYPFLILLLLTSTFLTLSWQAVRAQTLYTLYTVQANDTLDQIAASVGSNPQSLMALNRMETEAPLREGQMILVPAAVERRGKTVSHVIQSGDTLSRLAVNYNTTTGVLMWLNGIENPNQIYAGRSLLVPVQPEPSEIAKPSQAPTPSKPVSANKVVEAPKTPEPSQPILRRIRFATGGTGVTITGTVTAEQQSCYTFAAVVGQGIILQISSPEDLANFSFAPSDPNVNEGKAFKPLSNTSRNFTQRLPATSDYIACVSAESDATSYALTMTIPPLSGACTTPTSAIRTSDWAQIVTNDPALKYETITGEAFVTVIDAPTSVSGYPLLDQVVYGDFDDNCIEEAAFLLSSGGSSGAIGYLVYRLDSPGPRLIASGSGSKLALEIANNRLVVNSGIYAGWEPNCCPSGLSRATYRLVDDVLVPVTSTTEGIPALQVATVEQFYGYLGNGNFANAYAMFSPAFKETNSFEAWQAGANNSVKFTISATLDPTVANRVSVTITTIEGDVSYTYQGAWDLVWGESGWLLDQGAFQLS